MKFNKLIPEFDVINLQESLKFYIDLIGFKVEYIRGENKFAYISLDKEIQFMLQELNKEQNKWETGKLEYPFGRGINFQIDVKEVEKIYSRLKEKGYNIMIEMSENWYRQGEKLLGCKEFLVMDPNGYLLRFSEDIGEKDILS
jgi:uncharacterized glyoxalase superfamily protein PhnB